MNSDATSRPSPYRWWVLALTSSVNFSVLGLSWMCLPALFHEMSQTSNFYLDELLFAWGIIPLAGLFANIPAGLLGDRFGSRWTSGIGLAGCAIFGALRSLSSSFPSFMVVMFLFGAVVSLATVNLPKVLGQWFPSEQLGLANGIMGASYGGGSGLALLISGTLLSSALGGWRNVIYLWAVLSAVLATVWMLTLRERPAGREATTGHVPKGQSTPLPSLLRKRQVLVLSLINLMFMGGWLGLSGSVPFLLEEVRAWPALAASGLISVGLWVYVLGSMVVPAVSDRVGLRRPILSTGLTVAGALGFASLLVAALLPAGWAVWALLAASALFGGASPLTSVVALESPSIGPDAAGTAVGVIYTAGSVGGFVFPFLNGAISGATPTVRTIIAVAALCQLVGYGGAGLLAWLLDETGPKSQQRA
jgi:nitrate/nitrite transporter NarK